MPLKKKDKDRKIDKSPDENTPEDDEEMGFLDHLGDPVGFCPVITTHRSRGLENGGRDPIPVIADKISVPFDNLTN